MTSSRRKTTCTGARLKSIVDDLSERVHALRSFDKTAEVNAYCDELESQVVLAIESIIKSVNATQEKLIAEINSYRVRLVPKDAAPVAMETDEADALQQELAALQAEIDSFNSKTPGPELQELEDDCKKRIKQVRKQLRQQAFQGDFLKFKEGRMTDLKSHWVGSLEICCQDVEEEPAFKHLDLASMKPEGFHIKPVRLFKQKSVYHVTFLSDGNLALCVSGGNIVIWSMKKKRTLFELMPANLYGEREPKEEFVRSMVQLPSGDLATGDCRGSISIWSLTNQQHVKQLTTLIDGLGSLTLLANENLVVHDHENKIAVVNPALETNNVIWSHLVSSRPHTSGRLLLQVLSNGQLLTFQEKHYKIWNSETGVVIKHVICNDSAYLRQPLSTGEIVYCFEDGVVRVYNLLIGKTLRWLHQAQHGRVARVVEQADGSLLLVHLNKSSFALSRKNFTVDSTRLFVSPGQTEYAVGCPGGCFLVWRTNE